MLRVFPHLVHHVPVDELDPAGIFQRARRNDPLVLVHGDAMYRRRCRGGGCLADWIDAAVAIGCLAF